MGPEHWQNIAKTQHDAIPAQKMYKPEKCPSNTLSVKNHIISKEQSIPSRKTLVPIVEIKTWIQNSTLCSHKIYHNKRVSERIYAKRKKKGREGAEGKKKGKNGE